MWQEFKYRLFKSTCPKYKAQCCKNGQHCVRSKKADHFVIYSTGANIFGKSSAFNDALCRIHLESDNPGSWSGAHGVGVVQMSNAREGAGVPGAALDGEGPLTRGQAAGGRA